MPNPLNRAVQTMQAIDGNGNLVDIKATPDGRLLSGADAGAFGELRVSNLTPGVRVHLRRLRERRV